jgi:hypothetical protein
MRTIRRDVRDTISLESNSIIPFECSQSSPARLVSIWMCTKFKCPNYCIYRFYSPWDREPGGGTAILERKFNIWKFFFQNYNIWKKDLIRLTEPSMRTLREIYTCWFILAIKSFFEAWSSSKRHLKIQCLSRRKHNASPLQIPTGLMLLRKIITVYSVNCKPINTLWTNKFFNVGESRI